MSTVTKGQQWYREQFLPSPWWRQVKTLVRKRDGYKCSICGKKETLHFHHLSYTHITLLNEALDVRIVCKTHHRLCHFTLFHKIPFTELKRRYEYLKKARWRRVRPSDIFDFIHAIYKV